MTDSDEDPQCNEVGLCTAHRDGRAAGVSPCIHCGKTLVLNQGRWLTWDHEDYRNPVPQLETSDA